jgi:hypothetical protein
MSIAMSSRNPEMAVEVLRPCTHLTTWSSNVLPVTAFERRNGSNTVEAAIAVAMVFSARERLIAKPTAVVAERSVSDTTKIKKERPNMMGMMRPFVISPTQLIKANITYTLKNGIKVNKEQTTTCFKYPRAVLNDDSRKLKELKSPSV